MPQCASCGHQFAVSNGFHCPACNNDWRHAQATASDTPAHLSVLDGSTSSAKPRLVSSAGPAVPVIKQQNDSVPNGWMARLEAAKMLSTQSTRPDGTATSTPPALPKPPPLKSNKPKKRKKKAEKPAHLLVAQLQAEEERRRTEQASQLSKLFTTDDVEEIAKVEVPNPEKKKRRRFITDRIIIALLIALVGAGVVYAYKKATKEPAPKAVVDPALLKAAENKKKALESIEAGRLALEKKDFKAAITAYDKARSLDEKLEAEAVRGLAIAYTNLNKKADAVKHYRRYLELKPTAKDAKDVRKIVRDYEKSTK